MWQNLRGFRVTLDDDAAQRMTLGAAAMTACAVAFVAARDRSLLGWAPRCPGRRSRGRDGLVMLPRSPCRWPRADSASPRRRRFGAARRPSPLSTREKLAGRGCSASTARRSISSRRRSPTGGFQASVACSTAAHRCTWPRCGRRSRRRSGRPWQRASCLAKNGVRSAATYTAAAGGGGDRSAPGLLLRARVGVGGLFAETTQTSAAVRAAPLWSILGRAGLSSTIVRWPLTWPAQPLAGRPDQRRISSRSRICRWRSTIHA